MNKKEKRQVKRAFAFVVMSVGLFLILIGYVLPVLQTENRIMKATAETVIYASSGLLSMLVLFAMAKIKNIVRNTLYSLAKENQNDKRKNSSSVRIKVKA